ncbi:UPF0481 protein At3g47200-like isoform X2 [Carex rostrata]
MNGRDGTVSIDIINNKIDETTTNPLVSNNSIDEIKQKLQDLPGNPMESEKFTFFRVPAHIRQKNKELYEPKMISIGPYYNGNNVFQAMEKHKYRYLRDYLSRNTRNSFDHCINELSKLESQARRCYFEESNLQSDKFLKMMLLDGCFIIEFLIKWYSGFPDEIFDVGWVLPIIRSDLLLLENQIPFFVIQKLFELLTSSDPVSAQEITSSDPVPTQEITSSDPVPTQEITSSYHGIVKMLLYYFSRPQFIILVEIKHILHLYHLCYMPRPSEVYTKTYGIQRWLNPIKLVCFRKTKLTNGRFPRTIPSATELKEAGVTFKCNESENILDIKFQNGTLEIPFISIEETHRSRLLNLVFFEQYYSKLDMDLTSYACFMGSLFRNARDVTLLQKIGIVDNLLATNDELVSFFNWLTECSYLDYDKHYLKELVIDVNRYYISDWHRWRATLKRDYFRNPWSTISFTAAFALLAFTVLQTLYTILSYYHHKN